MDDLLWNILGVIAILNWCHYVFLILPKLRETRTLYLSDWGFTFDPFHGIKNLKEYKSICLKENSPLIAVVIDYLKGSMCISQDSLTRHLKVLMGR